MQDIFIEETDTTPEIKVNFTEGIFEIKGVSIPEDSESFYQKVLESAEKYIETNPIGKTQLIFKLVYINTSTSAILGRFIKLFESVQRDSHDSIIVWYYEEGDEDMKDIGNDFRSFTKLALEIVECEEII